MVNKFRQMAFVLVLIFSTVGFGQQNVFRKTNNFTQSQMSSLTFMSVIDPEITVPKVGTFNPKSFIRLKADSELGPFTRTRTTIDFKFQSYKSDGTLDANVYTKLLTVEYNPQDNSTDFSDQAVYELTNSYGLKAQIISINTLNVVTGVTTNIIQPNISLDLSFEAERYYAVTEQSPIVIASQLQDIDSTPLALNLQWEKLVGAVEYEVEWTWVDNYSTNISTNISTIGEDLSPLTTSQIIFSERDFELNNTRIRTTNTNYEIPLVYSRGYIIFRVRVVGRFWDDSAKEYFGPWSYSDTIKDNVSNWQNYKVSSHENLKNWQFQASYAEEGKKKEVVSYFDGSLRNRQTVTKVNTDNNAVVGEVIYDTQGRSAVEILPVPIYQRNYIRFFKNLNTNVGNNPFTHYDFDWDNTIENNVTCNPISNILSRENGSGQYYSKYNQFLGTNSFAQYIPESFGFPYSQVEYTPDNTGRILRKGGVGNSHQLGTEHEMKYFYSVPNQEELNRLFGYEVGYVSHYKKNIVVDPNGQVSVSYLDPQGRTIATALAGDPEVTENLVGLEDAGNSLLHNTLTSDLISKLNQNDFNTDKDNNELESTYNFLYLKDKLSVSKQLGVAGKSKHNFEYIISNKEYFTPSFCNKKYSFVYDLDISLKDKCAEQMFPSISQQIGISNLDPNPLVYVPITPPTLIDPLNVLINQAILGTGSYSLLKELKVNKEVLNAYADEYIRKLTTPPTKDFPQSECYIPQNSFAPAISIDCDTDCSECEASIGTEEAYVLDQLNGIYLVPQGVATIFQVDPATFFVTIDNLPVGSPINYGQQPLPADVAGFVVKLRSEWKKLKTACDQLCGPTFASACQVNEAALITDVSPNGQYGATSGFGTTQTLAYNPDGTTTIAGTTVNPSNDITDSILSVFNESSVGNPGNQIILNGETIDNDWRHPIACSLYPDANVYRDETNAESKITVSLNLDTTDPNDYIPAVLAGQTPIATVSGGILQIRPEQLANINDFFYYWEPTWAKSLLKYHPEYCYLEYSNGLCKLTKDTPVIKYASNGSIAQTINKDLTSDEYDGYLDYIDTYQNASNQSFVSYNSEGFGNQIMLKDPYFSGQIVSFENSNLYSYRQAIMQDAINTHYENLTQNSGSDTGTGGAAATLFQAAVMTVKCNAIQTCTYSDFDFNTFTDEEKNRVWNSYKNLYRSLKTKIKSVFINVYAKSNGCSNVCIGGDGSVNITNSLVNYPVQRTLIDAYITANPPAASTPILCNHSSILNYSKKLKRFIPADSLYNSDITNQAAVDQLQQLGTYQAYVQTGKCPLLSDLNMYFNDFFTNFNLASPSSGSNPFSGWNSVGQGLSRQLFKELIANPAFVLPSTTTPTVSITNPTSTLLRFTFSPTALTSATNQLSLQIPASSNLTWSNYRSIVPSATDWHIIAFDQIYYDESNVSTPGQYAFSIKARVVIGDAASFKDIVLTGFTNAKIGGCHLDGTPGIGQVLIPEVCKEKRVLFETGIMNLYNSLVATNHLNDTTYSLPFATYGSNNVFSHFGITTATSADELTWNTVGTPASGYRHSIKKNNVSVVSLEFAPTTYAIQQNSLLSLSIDGYIPSTSITTPPLGNYVTAVFRTTAGVNISLQGEIRICKDGDCNMNIVKRPIYLVCCSPCGENDYNGDGLGDSCLPGATPANIVACPLNELEEIRYENNLKNVLNFYLNTANPVGGLLLYYDVANVPSVNQFVNQCNLQVLFQKLRNTTNPFYSQPVAQFQKFDFLLNGITTSIKLYNTVSSENIDHSRINLWFPLENANSILNFDIVGPNTANITYTTLSQPSIPITTNIVFNHGTVRISSGLSIGQDKFCEFISAPLPATVNACPTNTAVEVIYENNLRDVLNYFIQNNTRISNIFGARNTKFRNTK
jgi:hypothetical protein